MYDPRTYRFSEGFPTVYLDAGFGVRYQFRTQTRKVFGNRNEMEGVVWPTCALVFKGIMALIFQGETESVLGILHEMILRDTILSF
jgi:hypothetical protein